MKHSSSSHQKKQKPAEKKGKKEGKIINWKEYNEALVNRGRITFWITEEAIKAWEEAQETDKKRESEGNHCNIAMLPLKQVSWLVKSFIFLSDKRKDSLQASCVK